MLVAMVVGLIAGIFLGFVFNISYPSAYSFYITMGLLAAMDSVVGAVRSYFEGKFDNLTFVSGFITNALLAALLTFVGDLLGVPLYYAALLVFGGRLFNNLAGIRHHLIERHYKKKERLEAAAERKRRREEKAGSAAADDSSDDWMDILKGEEYGVSETSEEQAPEAAEEGAEDAAQPLEDAPQEAGDEKADPEA